MSRKLIANKYTLVLSVYGSVIAKQRTCLGFHGRRLRYYRVFETYEAHVTIYQQTVSIRGGYKWV